MLHTATCVLVVSVCARTCAWAPGAPSTHVCAGMRLQRSKSKRHVREGEAGPLAVQVVGDTHQPQPGSQLQRAVV